MSAPLRSPGIGGLARLVALVLLMLVASALPAAAQTFPKFSGLVVDDAGVLPAPTKAELTTKLEALQKDTKRQLVVVTIRDMGGEDLAAYTNKLFRAWGVGLNDIDNGVILLLAPNNPAGQRGPRIEVGYGLEPVLTDALSSVIINRDMMPRLKAGDIPGAVTAGVDAIDKQLRASPEEAQSRQDAAEKEFNRTHQRQRSGDGGFPLGLVFWGLVIGFVLLSAARRGSSGMGSGGRRYRSSGVGGGLGQVVLWGIANEIANNAFRGGGGHRDDGVRGWGDGGGGWGGGGGGSDGSWGGGGFTGGGGGDSGGGGASGSW